MMNACSRRIGPRTRSLARTLGVGSLALAAALLAADYPVRGASADLVISQVYGGGGNSGAPYRNDFVEIFNRGSAAVSLAGKSIQYASATGTGSFSGNPIAPLSGTLQPGQYYLVQLAGGANGVPLPTSDATGTANMSGTGGKVALVNSTAGLACNGGSTPCSAAQLALIVDLVGWDGANFYEGAAAPATTNATAVFRGGGGCIDTDSNAADFAGATPAPRNTASPTNVCGAPTPPTGVGLATPAAVAAGDPTLLTVAVTPGGNPTSTGLSVSADLSAIGGASPQAFYDDGTHGDASAGDNAFSFATTIPVSTTTGVKSLPFTVSDAQSRSRTGSISVTVVTPPIAIHEVQGAGAASPYDKQAVTTRGVVTARRYNNGFFIQTPDELVDADPNTSEGVFVYTGGAPPAVAAVGAYVQVSGTVAEFVPPSDPNSPPMTEITSPVVTALDQHYGVPAPRTLSAADLPAGGTLEQLERCEGMRVFVSFLRVVSPTDGSVNAQQATSSSNGVFYAVVDGTPRPFREPGVRVLDPLPDGAPPNVPRFDFNPERLRVDSDGQVGALRIEVTSGALLSDVTGVLDYGYRTWTILPDPSPAPAVSGVISGVPVPAPGGNEFTVASFNLEGFYDTVNDPGTSDDVLTAAAFERRLNKASLAIRTMMLMPDIIGVQEAENLATLETLAARINADAMAAGGPDPGYKAYLEEGNDVGGIDVGFLVRLSRVTVDGVVQEGKDATYIDPNTNAPAILNDRPPLVLTAEVQGPTGVLPITAIVNHLRSLGGVEDPVDGRVRAKRLAQAEFLANLIQTRQLANPYERIISVGDYNAYEVNDGFVDVIGTIKGTPVPADQVVLAATDPVNPGLTDLVDLVPAAARYSYSFDGTAQVLDHVIANGHALQRFSRMHFARSNADFPESYRSDGTRAERVSDHDMPVAYFVFPGAPVLRLNGANPLPVECCGTYADPGATATDADYGDISSQIVVTGAVNADLVGSYEVTYSVSNGYTTTTASRTVQVADTTPPALTLVGDSPMTVEVGGAFVDPGATADDTCAGDLTGAIVASDGVDPGRVGTYRIVYRVTDGYNITSVTRVVNVVDTTPPVVSPVLPTSSVLWPPNHQMTTVGLAYTVADNSGSASCSAGVVSNELVNGTGDGDTAPDWVVIDGTSVQLRVERAGTGTGRVYTVTVTCRDASGNAAVRSATVSVPKSNGR
jgi:uncharacterized protein